MTYFRYRWAIVNPKPIPGPRRSAIGHHRWPDRLCGGFAKPPRAGKIRVDWRAARRPAGTRCRAASMSRGRSSIGRASVLQAEGCGFDPHRLHRRRSCLTQFLANAARLDGAFHALRESRSSTGLEIGSWLFLPIAHHPFACASPAPRPSRPSGVEAVTSTDERTGQLPTGTSSSISCRGAIEPGHCGHGFEPKRDAGLAVKMLGA